MHTIIIASILGSFKKSIQGFIENSILVNYIF